MAEIDKVRVILLGDSGVGKTSLNHLIAYGEPLTNPSWTIGCSVETKLHEYKEGTQQQNTFFIELFDVGGSSNHKSTRSVLYNSINGIILVHDLTNKKSYENLWKWTHELLDKTGKDVNKYNDELDFETKKILGTNEIPILVIGTKLDLLDEKCKRQQNNFQANGIAVQCKAEEIWLNCHDVKSLSAGTTNAVKLSKFFDKIIEKKHYSKESVTYKW